jgi:hypothetical protein
MQYCHLWLLAMAFDEMANTTSGAASHAMILIDIRPAYRGRGHALLCRFGLHPGLVKVRQTFVRRRHWWQLPLPGAQGWAMAPLQP